MDYQSIDLNGLWQLAGGEQKPSEYRHQCPVPALVDMARPAFDWTAHSYFWYKRTVALPPLDSANRVWLQLEQVQFGTAVYVNGRFAGGDIPCYTSQYFDITDQMRPGKENIIEVRVGTKETLPQHSAVGNDFEKLSFIPGIWGDVRLHIYHGARISWLNVLPDISSSTVLLQAGVEILGSRSGELDLEFTIREKSGRRLVAQGSIPLRSNQSPETASNPPGTSAEIRVAIPDAKHWSPEQPFLYEAGLVLRNGPAVAQRLVRRFGMRSFEIRHGHFYLNGQQRRLYGSNIAFHRLLSDQERGLLPWDEQWIRKVLVEIPKAHHLFFFRFHLGHAYNRWYDLADEYGIMLQDEWMFWTTTGSGEQIRREFTDWIRENGHHPSIVIWDPLNESKDALVTDKIIPEMKKIDPTRVWEAVDFGEDHPYIFSLGPVLQRAKFGFSRSLEELQNSPTPVMVNEYLWWWLDGQGKPSQLTEMVIERWLGKNYSSDDLLRHQVFLAQELTELWRRLDLDAIMPFVYLSCGQGATSHWFSGPLAEARPKPLLQALKNAFSPLGLSLELWDRHFQPGEQRRLRLHLFNDSGKPAGVRCIIVLSTAAHRDEVLFERAITLEAGKHQLETAQVAFPSESCSGQIHYLLQDEQGQTVTAGKKPCFVLPRPPLPAALKTKKLSVFDHEKELLSFLKQRQIRAAQQDIAADVRLALVGPGGLRRLSVQHRQRLARMVAGGGCLILQEPECGITGQRQVTVFEDLKLWIQYRPDRDMGGYDSCVIPADAQHPLWQGIAPEHLQIWNGAWGGEMVSQHHLRPDRPFRSLADCNLRLRVAAVLEIPYGRGMVIVSRLQVRGRLSPGKEGEFFARRYDPVAARYLLNLLAFYPADAAYAAGLAREVQKTGLYIARAEGSDGQVYDLLENHLFARQAVYTSGRQWLDITFDRDTALAGLVIKKVKAELSHLRLRSGKVPISADIRQIEKDNQRQLIITCSETVTSTIGLDYSVKDSGQDAALWEVELLQPAPKAV